MVQPAGQQAWSRSRYPLQTHLPVAVKLPEEPSHPIGGNQAPPDMPLKNATVTTKHAAEHEAHDSSLTQSEQQRKGNTQISPSSGHHDQWTDDERTELNSSSSRSSSPSYHRETTMTLGEEEQPQQSQSPTQGPGMRTLRRSPRSRRIEARISLADIEGTVSSSQSTSDKAETTATEGVHQTNSGRQQQAGASDSMNSHPLPISPPESESETDSINHYNTSYGGQNSVANDESTRQHSSYPLQAPASRADLKRPLTPPSPPYKPRQMAAARIHDATTDKYSSLVPLPIEMDHTKLMAQAQQAKASVMLEKQPRRPMYPLQSPASIVNLRQQQQQQQQSASTKPERSTTSQNFLAQGSSPQPSALRRKKYPLQSPASVADLKASPSSSGSHRGKSFSRNDKHVEKQASSSAFRRRGYPLQAPASTADLRHSSLLSRASSVTAVSEAGTENEVPRRSPPPSYGSEGNDNGNQPASRILLPKNIRAVKDAEKPLNGRTIVICLDGTGDKFDDDNSNIVHIVSALKKDDPNQVTYYQAGIGTYNDGGLSTGFDSAMDMAVGSGLGLHIRDGYKFLMHSYKEGDRICIFGFSRGAYTARCLAGMIHKVGLLPPRNTQQVNFAYDFYKKDTPEGWKQSADFKRAFSIDVNVYFLGCFDSVASVGFIPRQLPLSSTPSSKARYFRHAMALDERRAKFKICRYQSAKRQQGEEQKIETETKTTGTKLLGKMPHTNVDDQHDGPPSYSAHARYGKDSHPNVTQEEYDRLYNEDDEFHTDVKEVWFAGCHADVGGGAVANDERHKLAQIPLRWMVRQAFECNTGIIFKTRFLAEYGLDVHTLWPKYERLDVPHVSSASPTNFLSKYDKALPPRSIRRGKLVPVNERMSDHNINDKHHHNEPLFQLNSHEDEDWTPEQVEDYYDAMSPMNDQLVQAPTWWILEALPVQYKMSTKPGEILVHTGPNMGLARMAEEYEANIHWTVVQRAQQLNYKAAVRPAKHTEWKVVV